MFAGGHSALPQIRFDVDQKMYRRPMQGTSAYGSLLDVLLAVAQCHHVRRTPHVNTLRQCGGPGNGHRHKVASNGLTRSEERPHEKPAEQQADGEGYEQEVYGRYCREDPRTEKRPLEPDASSCLSVPSAPCSVRRTVQQSSKSIRPRTCCLRKPP
jgi:hypothetical protein